MQTHTEDTDQLGPYYKKRFEELSEIPGDDVKENLFAKMDMLEGKMPKTIYLHINLFGMKIAASITMLVVSSLALVAVAAVTVVAIRNNTPKKKTEAPLLQNEAEEILKTKETTIKSSDPIPEVKQNVRQIQEIEAVTPILNEAAEIQEDKNAPASVPVPIKPLEEASPIQKNGDNSKLLKEIDKEEDLFGK